MIIVIDVWRVEEQMVNKRVDSEPPPWPSG